MTAVTGFVCFIVVILLVVAFVSVATSDSSRGESSVDILWVVAGVSLALAAVVVIWSNDLTPESTDTRTLFTLLLTGLASCADLEYRKRHAGDERTCANCMHTHTRAHRGLCGVFGCGCDCRK